MRLIRSDAEADGVTKPLQERSEKKTERRGLIRTSNIRIVCGYRDTIAIPLEFLKFQCCET
jgi:hypothetical protein